MLHLLSIAYFAGLFLVTVALLGAVLRDEAEQILNALRGMRARTLFPALPPRGRSPRATRIRTARRPACVTRAAA